MAGLEQRRVLHVVGCRPNFMKLAPVWNALNCRSCYRQLVVHTGQHYNHEMSGAFFEQLEIPAPDVNLEVGSATHAQQTAQILSRFEPVLHELAPELVLVYGDVNSTLAAALTCAKMLIPVGHVEAGLRSGDRHMPEEINRRIVDQLSEMLFTPSVDADENLKAEGISPARIHRAGNVMIDTLLRSLPAARPPGIDLPPRFLLVTLHRPSNVDNPHNLKRLLELLTDFSQKVPIVFPIHPRTRERLASLGATPASGRFLLVDPMGYLEFIFLERHAAAVLTDSGGIQEETTFLGVPCFTLRNSTERPITVSVGTNEVIGADFEKLRKLMRDLLAGRPKQGAIPPLWDGKASERIAAAVDDWFLRPQARADGSEGCSSL